VLENIICAELKLDLCRDHRIFCDEMDIDPDRYDLEVGGALSDLKQARSDETKTMYCLSAKDRMWLECAAAAAASGNHEALEQFKEPNVGFGMVDQLLLAAKVDMPSIFKRYEDLYTWSRWDKVIFLSRVPRVVKGVPKMSHFHKLPSNFYLQFQKPDEDEGDRPVRPVPHVRTYKREKPPAFYNFNPTSSWSPMRRFRDSVLATFSGEDIKKSVNMALRRKFYVSVPVRALDGLFEIGAYLFVVMFPALLGFYGVILWYCTIIY